MLSRRTNLNTVRKDFSWSSEWTHVVSHVQALWIDNKIFDYFIGIFYSLKIPTSNYVIRRLFNQLVLIEADLFIFNFKRFIFFVHMKKNLFFLLYKIKKWLRHRTKWVRNRKKNLFLKKYGTQRAWRCKYLHRKSIYLNRFMSSSSYKLRYRNRHNYSSTYLKINMFRKRNIFINYTYSRADLTSPRFFFTGKRYFTHFSDNGSITMRRSFILKKKVGLFLRFRSIKRATYIKRVRLKLTQNRYKLARTKRVFRNQIKKQLTIRFTKEYARYYSFLNYHRNKKIRRSALISSSLLNNRILRRY
jgi:hypothetical protein